MSNKKSFPFLITAFAAICLSVLLGLGVWQLQRLEWKLDKIEALNNAYDKPAETLNTQTLSQPIPEYKKAQLDGIFETDAKTFLIQSKTYERRLGYHLIRPASIEGITVFVNLGWVPEDFEIPELNENSVFNLTGVFYPSERSNAFVPDNQAGENLWYWPDTQAMAKITGAKRFVEPVFRVTPQANTSAESQPPIPVGDKPELKNDHLQYAAFWFTMACLFIIVFMIFLSRRMRDAAR